MLKLLILAGLVLIMLWWVKYRTMPALREKLGGADPPGVAGGAGGRRSELLSRPIDPAVLTTVLALLAGGSKLRALSMLRNSGLGLAAARALLAAIEGGHRPPTTNASVRIDEQKIPDLASRARALRRDGFDRDAIDLVRTETGMEAAAAAKFVKAL